MDEDVMRAKLEASLLSAMDATAKPAAWGRDDCALWAATVIKDALGYDPAEQWRGRYDSRTGAAELLGRIGLPFAIKRMAAKHGWKRVHPAFSDTGDVGLAMVPAIIDGSIVLRPTTFICRSPGWWVARAERGYFAAQSHLIRVAWAVA